MRSLYSARPNPYYIVAPDYRRSSAGIRVMHMLCDALNRSGHEAYVLSGALSPALMTPYLANHVRALHAQQGLEPIFVYPEVISGNPLNGDVVARYILNTPGFLVGGEGFSESDIMFAFAKGLVLPGMPEDNIMFLQPVDLSVFKPPVDSAVRIPGRVCYYQGRSGKGIDRSRLPKGSVEITGDYPATWEELVNIFQTCEFFYSSATSALSAEAVLCGCIGVVIPGAGAPSNFSSAETGNYGVAWGTAPEEIERARRTAHLLRETLQQQEVEFWHALDHFIDVTQQAAADSKIRKLKTTVAARLETRMALASQSPLVSCAMQPLLRVFILVRGDVEHKLAKTLESLAMHNLAPVVVSAEGNGVKDLNRAIFESACDAFIIAVAGEVFTVGGLEAVSRKLAGLSGYRAAYADEVIRLGDGRLEPVLRPDINPDSLIGFPGGGARHWLFRRDLWQQMGGFSNDCGDVFELHFILSLIQAGGLTGLEHVCEPLLICDPVVLRDDEHEMRVITGYVQASGFDRAQVASRFPGRYEVSYGHVGVPIVSILLLIDGNLLLAQRCMDSLLEKTTYGRYEVLLLDHGNDDPLVVKWLLGIEQLGVAQLRVLRYVAEASPDAIRNDAVNHAQGDFLLFLDAATAVLGNDWLQQLLNHAMRPEVGCVGAKMFDGDGKISRAALLLGMDGPVGNPFRGMQADDVGYMQRLRIDQNVAAVGRECMLLRRELFIAAGGFDEEFKPWSDIDLALRLQQAGYLNVWTPRAQLLISDAEAAPATVEQEDRMYDRWLPLLANDPTYNPGLSLVQANAFKLADTAWSDLPPSGGVTPPKLIAYPAGMGASGQHRIMQPFNAMREQRMMSGVVSSRLLSVVELERYDPDVVLVQRRIDEADLESMRRMNTFSRAFKVYELDEYLPEMPKAAFSPVSYGPEVLDRLRSGLDFMDRLIVPNQMLAEIFDGFGPDLRVMKSCLDPRLWSGLSSVRGISVKPRIGWVADAAYGADIELIAEIVKELADEVEWVFFGGCPRDLRSFVHEVHRGGNLESFPAKLAALNLDLAVAPLAGTLSNRCKSNMRLLEYGICGVPVICSDLEPYRDLPVTRVRGGSEGWRDAIRTHLSDPDASRRMGDVLQDCVRANWILEGQNLHAWSKAWLPF